ncbi:hypothetical protein P152DRAFT_396460 [Eremomyces bilateralis CBS 781.70]|uniref:N-acetyltransferase domain-containing protein n=1 Tax=Eremomyces bilateralis CBS 781.70 TaxID=1392243 RepID=A0A6G1G521_9PEZI|nr:uncharacterized protein P152DRAFT_396460 [Eremomyces bilateralis CBS 781.70]KAF1812929.1 hypothetical protein P152DRAFT_396460 [Eremomyces bilateralis CBS 781.70]
MATSINPRPALPPFSLRPARRSEQPTLANVYARGFWKDVLFGDYIHPYREKYPADNDLYWLRRMQVEWWDWTHRFIVSTVNDEKIGKEIVTGVAHWARLGPEGAKKYGLRWWDPRRIILPLSHLYTSITSCFFPNRAAHPDLEDVIERAYPFINPWTGSREESWYLEWLAVAPEYHGQGHGRALVQWGLDRAKEENICASVIAAYGKEKFYENCGFNNTAGTAGQGEGNPLADTPGGVVYFRDVPWESNGLANGHDSSLTNGLRQKS